MDIIVSATRRGLSVGQYAAAHRIITVRGKSPVIGGGQHVLRMGDCIGGDVQLANIARPAGYWIAAYPPIKDIARAFYLADEVREPKPYLERNADMVKDGKKASDVQHGGAGGLLIACPATITEQLRGSGTWHTILCAGKARHGLETIIIGPDGTAVVFREGYELGALRNGYRPADQPL